MYRASVIVVIYCNQPMHKHILHIIKYLLK